MSTEKESREVEHLERESTGENTTPENGNEGLHRGLKARHLSMIALGGAIGSGLIIGSGQALASYGPAPLLIGYVVAGVLCYIVVTALGEMATWLPLGSSFPGYATRYVDPALGFAMGYGYLFKYLLQCPNQLTSLALVVQFWIDRERVNPGVWIAIALVACTAINYLDVAKLGEIEFWLCVVKLLVLLGFILLSIVLVSGGGPSGHATGFVFYHNPGAFKPYIAEGATGKFLAVWSALNDGVFAYLGSELVGVTVGEARNPRRAIPRAVKMTFWRISFFYILTAFFIGMLVPYNSPHLAFAQTAGKGAAASPFVVAVQIAGIRALPSIINAAVIVFNFSAAVTDMYVSTRMLYSLALQRQAPGVFARTDSRHVPIWSLAVSSLVALLAFMNVSTGSTEIFGYLVALTVTFGLLTWISILLTHIAFIRARRAQGVLDSDLHYHAPLGKYGSIFALAFCIIIVIFKGYTSFTGAIKYKTFLTNYLPDFAFVACAAGCKVVHRTERVRPPVADIWSGKAQVDRDELGCLATREALKRSGRKEDKVHWLYQHSIGVLRTDLINSTKPGEQENERCGGEHQGKDTEIRSVLLID